MPFEPITTQEAIDALLATERQNTEQRFNGWMSPEAVQQQYQGYTSPEDLATLNTQHQTELQTRDTRIAELEGKILRGKIADEEGLPAKLADRLTGKDEAAMRADAKELAKLLNVNGAGKGYPPANPNGGTDKKQAANAALRAMFGH